MPAAAWAPAASLALGPGRLIPRAQRFTRDNTRLERTAVHTRLERTSPFVDVEPVPLPGIVARHMRAVMARKSAFPATLNGLDVPVSPIRQAVAPWVASRAVLCLGSALATEALT